MRGIHADVRRAGNSQEIEEIRQVKFDLGATFDLWGKGGGGGRERRGPASRRALGAYLEAGGVKFQVGMNSQDEAVGDF